MMRCPFAVVVPNNCSHVKEKAAPFPTNKWNHDPVALLSALLRVAPTTTTVSLVEHHNCCGFLPVRTITGGSDLIFTTNDCKPVIEASGPCDRGWMNGAATHHPKTFQP